MTLTPSQLRALLNRHEVRPSRALGQNFVIDANIVRRIVRLAEIRPGDRVVEIGPGLGSLSLALVEAGADLTVVEVDRHLIAPLHEVLDPHGVKIIHADAMTFDWAAHLAGAAHTLVANLPYNIATPLVADLLDKVPLFAKMVVMVQREVADRLAAPPGSRSYGAVSVKVAYWATARVVATVPRTVFHPQPNVDSALLRIERRPLPAVPPEVVSPDALFALVRAGFAQRRKMLRRALAGVVSPDAFAQAGVDPQARAESLDVAAWGRLAGANRSPSGLR